MSAGRLCGRVAALEAAGVADQGMLATINRPPPSTREEWLARHAAGLRWELAADGWHMRPAPSCTSAVERIG